MKRILKAVALAVAALAISTSAQAQSALNEILDQGVLKVGTTGDWNPMSVRDPATNSYKGFDIDVMKQLADDLGVELEFVPTDWKTLVNGVVAGKYHMTGSASISPARMKVAGFSDIPAIPQKHATNPPSFPRRSVCCELAPSRSGQLLKCAETS